MVFNWVGAWLWVSMFNVFWVLFRLFSVGVFWPHASILCVCARCLAHLVYIGSGYSTVLWGFLFLVCVHAVLLFCPLYNPVGVVLLSLCGLLVFLVVVH